jgi:hypothetical protein
VDLGTYSAKAEVVQKCDHRFGQWKDLGGIGHGRTCSLCKVTNSQPHQWDEGRIQEKPNDPYNNIKVFTCSVCGGTKEQEVPASQGPAVPPATQNPNQQQTQPTNPTLPTKPTEPSTQTKPTATTTPPTSVKPTTSATSPTAPQKENGRVDQETQKFQDYNAVPEKGDSVNAQDHAGHTHSNEDSLYPDEYENPEELPIAIPVATDENGNANAEHTHDHPEDTPTTTDEIAYAPLIVLIALFAVAVTSAILVLKKKR